MHGINRKRVDRTFQSTFPPAEQEAGQHKEAMQQPRLSHKGTMMFFLKLWQHQVTHLLNMTHNRTAEFPGAAPKHGVRDMHDALQKCRITESHVELAIYRPHKQPPTVSLQRLTKL